MKNTVLRHAAACLVSAAVLLGNAHGASEPASGAQDPPAKVSAQKAKKKKKAVSSPASQAGTVKFVPGSQETPAQRSTRLKRECKGQVNAGVCQGYTG